MVAAVGTGQPLAQPVATMPLVDEKGMVTQFWWRFFFGLFTRNASTVPFIVSTGLTATGTTQADALGLESEWNEVTSTPANTGVRLNGFGVGLNSIVFNQGGLNLKIYPPVGGAIDALGTNNPFTLANNTARDFYQLTATQFRSR
jgi:hypothetical protein